MKISERWKQMDEHWEILSWYQRFESIVAFVLTIIIGLIIVVALFRLTVSVVEGLVLGALDPLDHKVFQAVFGEILTLLIALEFNHTLEYVVAREQSIIQTKIVLLIALLALARKFIILDVHDLSALHLLGLAAITLVLAIAHRIVHDPKDHLTGLSSDRHRA